MIASAIPFLTFIGVLFVPESPTWLVRKKQNYHGARKAILKLKRDTLSFSEEVCIAPFLMKTRNSISFVQLCTFTLV